MDEIPDIIGQFHAATENARETGFDGIEAHGANGYLIDQFLRDTTNRRVDAYGGRIEHRMRSLNEILDAVYSVWPASRVGVRLSPENGFNSVSVSNPQEHFEYIVDQLSARNLTYVHVIEGRMTAKARTVNCRALRSRFKSVYITNNSYDLDRAQRSLHAGNADLVVFGVPFIANPDLVHRYRHNLPLATADQDTFYTGGNTGYTDYPYHLDEEAISA